MNRMLKSTHFTGIKLLYLLYRRKDLNSVCEEHSWCIEEKTITVYVNMDVWCWEISCQIMIISSFLQSFFRYLVPKDMSVGQFIHILSSRLHLTPGKALFVFVKNTLPQTGTICWYSILIYTFNMIQIHLWLHALLMSAL